LIGGNVRDSFMAKIFRKSAKTGLLLLILLSFFPPSLEGQDRPVSRSIYQPPREQVEAYNAQRVKSVIDLQQFRETTSITIENEAGRKGKATLINLNPFVNVWFLLHLEWADGRDSETYHLENNDQRADQIRLDPQFTQGIMIVSQEKRVPCDLWGAASQAPLDRARASGDPYAPLCGERLYLRNKTKGRKTLKEMVTDMLREHVWQGEKIVDFVKDTFYRDAFFKGSDLITTKTPEAGLEPGASRGPAPPLISAQYQNDLLVPADLGIKLKNTEDKEILVGRWYGVYEMPGVFFAALKPNLVSEAIIRSVEGLINPLDAIESKALVYLVAFDLDDFEPGFSMGTENPGVGWSDRVQEAVRDPSLPGPDGIGTVDPLVMTGMVSPHRRNRLAATFTGGFRRYHGAFRWGDLALKNHGSHYGFVEDGVVMSKLQPGLATALVFENGVVELKTWTEKDNANLARIRDARQNGVPIIEQDASTGASRPGALVTLWGPGNWSGSEDKRLRTLRAGLALQEWEGRRFLIYGYFSSASPSAMALVFQAFRCKYAMHLDMNALEHTYLALYRRENGRILIQHLIEGMDVLDKTHEGHVLPRFVGYADNRDFFYLTRKKER
jgi:hypothetical protein